MKRTDPADPPSGVHEMPGVGRASLLSLDPSADIRLFGIPTPRPVVWEFDLLPPEQCVTPFVGRERPLHDLLQWLREPWTLSTRGVEGPRGSGKTRLAHELIRRLPGGWQGGLVRPEDVRSLDPQTLAAPWCWDSPTLAVIDSASLCGPALRKWIESVAIGLAFDGPPLRLLLLDCAWDMWDGGLSQCRRAWFHASVDSTRIGPLPISPPRLSDLWIRAHRRSVFQAARAAAAGFCGGSEVAGVVESSPSDPRGTEASPASLMLLGIASIGAAIDASIDVFPDGADTESIGPAAEYSTEAAMALALRARARVQNHPLLRGCPVSAGFTSQAIAWITLRDGVPIEDLQTLLAELGGWSSGSVPTDSAPIKAVIGYFLGHAEGRIPPLPLTDATTAFVISELFGDNGLIRNDTSPDFPQQRALLRSQEDALSLLTDQVGYFRQHTSPLIAFAQAVERARALVDSWRSSTPADQCQGATDADINSGTAYPDESIGRVVGTPCRELEGLDPGAAVRIALDELESQRDAVRARIEFEPMDAFWRPPKPEFESVVGRVEHVRNSDPDGFESHSKLWVAELVRLWPGALRNSAFGWEAAVGAECRRLAREDPAIYLPVLVRGLERLCRQVRKPSLPVHPPEELRELTLAADMLAVSRPDECSAWPVLDDWDAQFWDSVHPESLLSHAWIEHVSYRLMAEMALPPEGMQLRISEACARLANAYFRLGDDLQGFLFAERALGVALRLADEWPKRYAGEPGSILLLLADASLPSHVRERWLTSLADQAVEWGTALIARNPTSPRGYLRLSLWHCAQRLKDRGEFELALYLAMAELRAAEAASAALQGGLNAQIGWTLASISDLYLTLDRPEDALPHLWRQIAIYRSLPPQERMENLYPWMDALRRLDVCLACLKREHEAVEPYRELIEYVDSQGVAGVTEWINAGVVETWVLLEPYDGLVSLLERLNAVEDAIDLGRHLLWLCYLLPDAEPPESGLVATQRLLWAVGRRNEALGIREAYARWAVEHLEERDASHVTRLGCSYCEQAILHFLLGDEAAAREAVDLADTLRNRREILSDPSLAAAIARDLARALWRTGRHPEAIEEARRSIELESRGVQQSSDCSSYWLMRDYATLAEMLVRPEDAAEALQITDTAMRLFASQSPQTGDSWSYQVSRCLFGRGRALHHLGRLSEATSAFEQSVAILRTAAESGDGGCKRRLATSLISLCWILSEAERLEAALPIAEESVRILRDLSPGAVLPTDTTRLLAEANLAALLLELDRAEEALQVADAALLAPFDPDFPWTTEERHRRAALLGARGGCLCRLDRHEEAEAEFRSGIALLKTISGGVADLESVAGLPSLLTSLALQLQLLGRSGEALDTAREAEGLLMDYAGTPTPRQTRLLTQCRIVAAQILLENGRLSDALDAANKAVSLAETLPGEQSRRGALLPARARIQVARVLAAQGQADLAMQTLRAAASELRPPTGTAPPAICRALLDEIAVVAEQIGREHNLPVDLELLKPSDNASVDGDV